MSTISKARKPRRNPNLTRNGRPNIKTYSLQKLSESLEKTSRPRDKRKIQNRINSII